MESAAENSSVLIVPTVRYSKNPTTKWDLNAKKVVPEKLYGKRIRKLLNGYYNGQKKSKHVFRDFFRWLF